MKCSATFEPPVHVIRLAGAWDGASASAFEEFCNNLDEQEPLRNVVLDLACVSYVSSFGLRTLLNLAKKLSSLRGGIFVVGLSLEVRKVFEGCGLLTLFPEFSDVESARREFMCRLGQDSA